MTFGIRSRSCPVKLAMRSVRNEHIDLRIGNRFSCGVDDISDGNGDLFLIVRKVQLSSDFGANPRDDAAKNDGTCD